MEMRRIYDFSLDIVAGASGAERLACRGRFRVGVARLHHEFVDYAVEEHSVVVAFFGQFYEIIAMAGGVAEEAHRQIAFGGLDFYQHVAGLVLFGHFLDIFTA